MTILRFYSSQNKLIFLLSLIVAFLISQISFAQINSIKELKEDARNLKDKGISISTSDPWTLEHIITPQELSKELSVSKTKKPVIYHVGFDFLFQQGHIPSSIYAGPASNQQGLDKIKSEAKNLSYDQYIVIYCGCCPWKDCPNIRQAYLTLKNLGFTNVKVLYIADTFAKDWKNKGYAVEGQNIKSNDIIKK
jgi:thiosulfate/3-mercaptopyruvate sulfurtransferase